MTLGATIALVFALVGIGYAFAWRRGVREGAGEALGDFVVTVVIPVLLFRTLSEASFGGARPLALWGVYFAAAALTWALATLAIRRGFGRDARAGVVAGLAASFSNIVLLGIPVTLALFGRAGSETLSLLIAVHLPLMMAASLVLHERAERRDGVVGGPVGDPVDGSIDGTTGGTRDGAGGAGTGGDLAGPNAGASAGAGTGALVRRFGVAMATNPIVVGIAAGLLWRLSPVALPGLVAELLDRLAGVAGTLALIALGMSLHRFGVARNVPQAAVTALFKLAVMPGTVTLLALAFGLPADVAQVVVVCAALPSGVNPYLLAARFGTGEALASNALLLGTAAAPLTLLFWAWLARTVFQT